jgi:nucleoside-diphosphate kinase
MSGGFHSMEQTLVLVKPGAVQRGLIGEIISRFERRGLKIVAMKMIHISRELAERFYGVHKGEPFYEKLVSHIISSPVVAIAVEGPGAVDLVRKVIGATAPLDAELGTIRADFAVEISLNVVHGSDSLETAKFEIGLIFRPEEIVMWSRDIDRWVFE